MLASTCGSAEYFDPVQSNRTRSEVAGFTRSMTARIEEVGLQHRMVIGRCQPAETSPKGTFVSSVLAGTCCPAEYFDRMRSDGPGSRLPCKAPSSFGHPCPACGLGIGYSMLTPLVCAKIVLRVFFIPIVWHPIAARDALSLSEVLLACDFSADVFTAKVAGSPHRVSATRLGGIRQALPPHERRRISPDHHTH